MRKLKNCLIIIAIIAMILTPIQVMATSDTLPDAPTTPDINIEGGVTDATTTNAELPAGTAFYGEQNFLENIVDGDVYQIGDNIEFKETVLGNVYLVGENVRITSKYIDGNVFVAANTITIDSEYIVGSVYLAGNQVSYKGETKSLYVAANNFTLEQDSSILRDIRVAASTVNINGKVLKDVYAGVNKLNVSDAAVVTGNLNYSSDTESNIPSGVVLGEVNFTEETNSRNYVYTTKDIIKNYTINYTTSIVTTVLIALIVLFCTPKFIEIKKAENPISKLFSSAGIGLLVLIVVPIVIVMLMISLVGLPLSFVLLLVYITLLIIASAIANIVITSRLINKIRPELNSKLYFLGILILVVIAVKIISKIPVIGWLIASIIYLSGIGELLFCKCKKEEAEVVAETK